MSTFQVCFVNTDQIPIKTQHVCFYTRVGSDSNKISLLEVYIETYPHPDAPEDAVVSVTQTRVIKEYNRVDNKAASSVLLEAAQKNCEQLLIRG